MLFILGIGLLAVSIWLGYRGTRLMLILKDAGDLSLQVWTNEFWLADPENYRQGFGPNGKWALWFFGSFWSFVFACALVKASRWMVRE
jgi:hypothetical protein